MSTLMRSAADIEEVGWPEFAPVLARALLAQEHAHEVLRRHRRGRMARVRAGARADAVRAQLLGERAPLLGPGGPLVYLLRHLLPPKKTLSTYYHNIPTPAPNHENGPDAAPHPPAPRPRRNRAVGGTPRRPGGPSRGARGG